ncbi:MAG: hypothetical protein Q8K32_31765 [Archangium sp.]|nr:hypothetical protein [Archangium sp.]
MTLTAAVFCLALSLGAEETAPAEVPAAKTAPNKLTTFDELPPLQQTSDDARVKRFIGAFTGGVVGLAASLALMPLGDTVGCFGGPCVSFVNGMVGLFAPLISIGGAWLGYALTGGDGGLLVPALALAPALLIALALLSLAQETGVNSALNMMPYVVTAGVFLAGGGALALDLRARQLARLGAAASWGSAPAGRVAVTSLVTGLAAGGAAAVSGLLFALGSFTALGPILLIAAAAAGSVGVAAAGWGVHRAMGGRGTFLSALTGLGIGALVTLAGGALFAVSQGGSPFGTFSPLRNTAGTILLAELGVASAVFSPALALEFSHTNAVEASLPTFTFGASPIAQGGMISAGLRF